MFDKTHFELALTNYKKDFSTRWTNEKYKWEAVKIFQDNWDINASNFSDMLPTMKTDITLTQGNKILIIDAKYYSQTTQQNYNTHKIHSNNLYQIFTYVKNMTSVSHKKVSGMLLYARTDETIQPDNVYQMSGNQISVKTLDLNKDFSEISAQLNSIITEHF